VLIDGFAEDVRLHRSGHGTTVRFVLPFSAASRAASVA